MKIDSTSRWGTLHSTQQALVFFGVPRCLFPTVCGEAKGKQRGPAFLLLLAYKVGDKLTLLLLDFALGRVEILWHASQLACALRCVGSECK